MKQSIKSKNKGFTLVELIAVIVIISVISIMSFASMTKTIKNSQIKEIEVFEANLKTAAQIYIETNLSDFTALDNVGGSVQMTVDTLISKGYLNKDIDNPSKCSLTDTFIVATKKENKTIEYAVYCVGDEIEEEPAQTYVVYPNGAALYFNPVTGSACSPDDAVSTTGTKIGCMKWYAFNDAGSTTPTINLILDHNTTATVAWNYSTGSNATGPVEILAQLKTDTSSWSGITTRIDSYSVSNGTSTYTINYSTYKARLITSTEIANITGNSSFNENTTPYTSFFYLDSNNQTQTATTTGASNYDWLFDYTDGCTIYGCNIADASSYGYWTSSSVAGDVNYSWTINRYGDLSVSHVGSSSNYGVRPVITINKSLFLPR